MSAPTGRFAMAAMLLVTAALSSPAQERIAAHELRVATRVVSPIDVEQNGALTGFSIGL